MKTRLIVTTVLLLVPCHLAGTAASETPRSGQFCFGWASTSITPQRPVAVAGQYHTRISGELHDPLLAAAVAVETRDESGTIDQAVWVSCDLAVMRRKVQERVRQHVQQRVPELDAQKIIISATHTHTAPALTDADETDLHPYDFLGSWAYRIPPEREDVMRPAEYLDFLAERLAAVVVEAWQARQPGGMSTAVGHAIVAHNRRAVYIDGTARMYGNTSDPKFSHIEGVSDHSVDLLFFWRGDRQLAGVAITVYCPAQEVEGQKYLSADFWYDARKMLRETYHADLWVLPLIGASGDQSPHLMWNKKRRTLTA